MSLTGIGVPGGLPRTSPTARPSRHMTEILSRYLSGEAEIEKEDDTSVTLRFRNKTTTIPIDMFRRVCRGEGNHSNLVVQTYEKIVFGPGELNSSPGGGVVFAPKRARMF